MRAIRFITAAALVLVASTASAQGGQGQGMTPEQRQQRQNEMLFKDITLTDVQKARIDTIQVKSREASAALMQAGGMQDPATREKMSANRQKLMADIRAVLTTEQMPQRGGNRPPA
jgi:Spy/CpxP family protein refolding chaperone